MHSPHTFRGDGAMHISDLIGDAKRIRIVILILFVVHMAIGLLGWDLTVQADGVEYARCAQNILKLGTFTYDGVHPVVGKPPGFSFLIAAYLWLTGSLMGFQGLQLIFMFLAFVFIAHTAARWIGWAGGLAILGVMVAAWPLHYLTRNLFAEAPFLALTSAGMYLMVRGSGSKRLWVSILAGVAFGISTYFRPINLFWPFALIVFAIIRNRKNLRTALVVCAVHVLVVAPWICRNWGQFGHPVPMVANWGPLFSMTDDDLWRKRLFQGSAAVQASDSYRRIVDGEFQFNWGPNERFRQAALENIRRDPLSYAKHCAWQSAFAWTYLPGTKEAYLQAPVWFGFGRAAMAGFYVLTVIGAAALMRARQPLAGLPAVYAAYTALILFPVSTESRYLVPAYLWLLPYTVAGIGALWRFTRDQRRRREGR